MILFNCAIQLALSQTGFNFNYNSGVKSGAFSQRVLSNNQYFVTSYFNDSSNFQQGIDFKLLDQFGTVISRKRYLINSYDYLSYLNNSFQWDVSDRTLLMSGASYSSNASVVIITSVNKSTLDTNFNKFYCDGIYNYNLNSVFKTKDNEFWFFGSKFEYNNSNYPTRPCAIKIDSSGNILSVKEFTNLINRSVRVACYDEVSQRLYIGGSNVTVPQNQISFLACMDTLGNVLWNNEIYSGLSVFGQMRVNNGYLVHAGGMFAGWFSQPNSNPTYKMHLLKVNCSNGAIIWQKNYGQNRSTNYLTSLIINADESIAASGCYYYKDGKVGGAADGVLLKVNSAGDSLWSQTYSNFSGMVQESFFDIKRTNDNGYLLCGVPFYAPDPTSQSWVVKTDSLGYAPGISTTLSTHETDVALKVFPNPVKDKLFLQFYLPTEKSTFELKIYNLLSELVYSDFGNQAKTTIDIDVNSFAKGVYLMQINSGSKSFFRKIVIE